MTTATYKPIEVSTSRTSLTPGIFDDDPVERDALSTLIFDMGYEPISTSDPEEALRLIRLGRCRLVFASIHLETHDPYESLARAAVRSGNPSDPDGPGIYAGRGVGSYSPRSFRLLPRPLDHIRLKRTLDDVACLYDQRRRVRALENSF
jgi:hypothetical protein